MVKIVGVIESERGKHQKLTAKIKQLEAKLEEYSDTYNENQKVCIEIQNKVNEQVKQLEADKESIERDRLAIATKYNNQMIKIKQLEDDLYHANGNLEISQQENQRLTEFAFKLYEYEYAGDEKYLKSDFKKALEGL